MEGTKRYAERHDTSLPAFQRISIREVCRRIKEIGANHSILTTDAFLNGLSFIADDADVYWYPLDQGNTKNEIEMMVRKNRYELLNV
jgi:hypothetical protein